MKIVLGILRALAILALVGILFFAAFNIVTDRCSMDLEDVDLTWEETRR